MKKVISIQSVSDIITNSSSEAFMLDTTKLSEEDLDLFAKAISEAHPGISYVDEYIKENPIDLIEFVGLIGLTVDDVVKYEETLRQNDELWIDNNNVEKFLKLHNKTLNDFSKFLVIFENEYNNDLLFNCYNDINHDVVKSHTFCF